MDENKVKLVLGKLSDPRVWRWVLVVLSLAALLLGIGAPDGYGLGGA